MPGAVAGLAEERGLLVAGDARDGEPGGQPLAARGRGDRRSNRPRRGSTARGMRRSASSSSSQASAWMLKSSVREALLASVTCARAAGELPGEPGVDGAEGELAALGALAGARPRCRAARRAWCRRSRRRARGRCARRRAPRGRPVAARHIATRFVGPARRSRWPPGGRCARSQSTVVSRWLVMPMAAMSPRRQPCRGEGLGGHVALRAPDFVGVVLDPAGLGEDLAEFLLCKCQGSGRRARRRWRASSWCLGRGRGRPSWASSGRCDFAAMIR